MCLVVYIHVSTQFCECSSETTLTSLSLLMFTPTLSYEFICSPRDAQLNASRCAHVYAGGLSEWESPLAQVHMLPVNQGSHLSPPWLSTSVFPVCI